MARESHAPEMEFALLLLAPATPSFMERDVSSQCAQITAENTEFVIWKHTPVSATKAFKLFIFTSNAIINMMLL